MFASHPKFSTCDLLKYKCFHPNEPYCAISSSLSDPLLLLVVFELLFVLDVAGDLLSVISTLNAVPAFFFDRELDSGEFCGVGGDPLNKLPLRFLDFDFDFRVS